MNAEEKETAQEELERLEILIIRSERFCQFYESDESKASDVAHAREGIKRCWERIEELKKEGANLVLLEPLPPLPPLN